ncbi:MAG: transporter substrate-binding protein [Sphingomonadales bacterium]|nr:transporter substrate-binding protein [Sphingomonadales bacterium]
MPDRRFAHIALYASLMLGGCGQRGQDDVLVASVIGSAPRVGDPDRAPLTAAGAELMRATRQGLVAFDSNGQVEPALAESWTFTRDGLSAIFRIKRLRWANGGEVTGSQVAASLNRAIATNSRNALKPLLTSIETVIGMTDRVVEIRLKVPRPNLLELLAQPELAIRRHGFGTGPWAMSDTLGGAMTLSPVKNDDDPATDEIILPPVARVILRGERASVATARFMARRGGFVMGGTLGDWPIAQAADLKSGVVRVDPADGLFGLAVSPRGPLLQDGGMRIALSMAIDRDVLVAGFGVPRWQAIERLLPSQLDSAQPPASPMWTTVTMAGRRTEAQRRVAAWVALHGPIAPLKVALPDGPGMKILFARLTADWRTIGVDTVRVAHDAPDADLRLIDEVAPNASANWYLTRTGCDAGLACDAAVDAALKASRAAPDLAHRSIEIAAADAAAAENAAYIPLSRPVRWSLVDPGLTGFHENSFAVHPLAELRPARN